MLNRCTYILKTNHFQLISQANIAVIRKERMSDLDLIFVTAFTNFCSEFLRKYKPW